MVLGNIQGREVMVVVFDFGPRLHLKSGTRKNLPHSAQRTCHGMQAAGALAAPWKRHVKMIARQFRLNSVRFEAGVPGLDRRSEGFLGLIDFFARPCTLLRGQLAEAFEFSRQQSLFAEEFYPYRIELAQVGGCAHGRLSLLEQLSQAAHCEP